MSITIDKYKEIFKEQIETYISNLKDEENERIIDGIKALELINNISLLGSNPRNILFLYDSHILHNTNRNL